MPPGQVTEAISKGVVDGAMGAWEVVLPTKLDEVTRYHAQPAAGQTYPAARMPGITAAMNSLPMESWTSTA